MTEVQEPAPKHPGGRPSGLSDSDMYCVNRLAVCGYNEEAIAKFLDVPLIQIAVWAIESKLFFDAITPPQSEIEAALVKFDRFKAARRKRKKLRATNAGKRIEDATRARVWASLKGRSDGRLFSRLGFSRDALMDHLAKQFQPGMSFCNYGDWHIDHIKPCSLFDLSDPEQFSACWALSNLQPLWALDNIRKGSKYVGG